MYEYQAVVRTVHDGDTIDVDLDLGFGVWLKAQSLRLLGLNAPELNTPEGKASQAALAAQLPVGTEITVQTVKDKKEKYGRWLAKILLNGQNLNLWLIDQGYAKPWDGQGPRPV